MPSSVSGAHSREVFNESVKTELSNGIRNTQRMTITWHNHNWILDGERALDRPLRDTLILETCILAVQLIFNAGMRSERQKVYFDSKGYLKSIGLQGLFLGDLFHSDTMRLG